jgi:hypothetical protein
MFVLQEAAKIGMKLFRHCDTGDVRWRKADKDQCLHRLSPFAYAKRNAMLSPRDRDRSNSVHVNVANSA